MSEAELLDALEAGIRYWTEDPDRCDMEGREREVAASLLSAVQSVGTCGDHSPWPSKPSKSCVLPVGHRAPWHRGDDGCEWRLHPNPGQYDGGAA